MTSIGIILIGMTAHYGIIIGFMEAHIGMPLYMIGDGIHLGTMDIMEAGIAHGVVGIGTDGPLLSIALTQGLRVPTTTAIEVETAATAIVVSHIPTPIDVLALTTRPII